MAVCRLQFCSTAGTHMDDLAGWDSHSESERGGGREGGKEREGKRERERERGKEREGKRERERERGKERGKRELTGGERFIFAKAVPLAMQNKTAGLLLQARIGDNIDHCCGGTVVGYTESGSKSEVD